MPSNDKPSSPQKNARLPQATIKHPTIQAVLGGHFRFATQEQARDRLKAIRSSFTVSKPARDEVPNLNEVKLWIRGYGMTAEAREAGYLGNFALLRVARATEEKWTIEATLLNIDKKFHPQRRQTEQKFPNWGYPILRDIIKKRVHATVEAAQCELQRMHEAFPEVSIPLATKLYLMVYCKMQEEGKPPVEKWVLEIAPTADATGFVIAYSLNTYHQKREDSKEAAGKPASESQGKFTSQVLLNRGKRKPRKPAARPKSKPEA